MSESSNDPLGQRDHKLGPTGYRVVQVVLILFVLAVLGGLAWWLLPLFGSRP